MQKRKLILLASICLLLISCQKQLDVKPDKKLVEPVQLSALQNLLNNDSYLNDGYIPQTEVGSDNYYLTTTDFNAQNEANQRAYLWDSQAGDIQLQDGWRLHYRNLLYPTLVLEQLEKIKDQDIATRNDIKGQAHFFRAWILFNTAVTWAMPYNTELAPTTPGIPLRLTSDINAPTVRASLADTYQLIIADLETAIALLPISINYVTRPSRPAAYALLARVALSMRAYKMAYEAATQSLQLYNQVLDYNELNAGNIAPVPARNVEVIFHCGSSGGTNANVLRYQLAKVDTVLLAMYAPNDLRKQVFFARNSDNSYYFKGNYNGSRTAIRFNGLAVDEVLLIAAETAVREGRIQEGLGYVNHLLQRRWKRGEYANYETQNAKEALMFVLNERRKQLCFRSGLRWQDLRRFSFEPELLVTPIRKVNNVIYTLPSGSLLYASMIPYSVIQLTGIQQNSR